MTEPCTSCNAARYVCTARRDLVGRPCCDHCNHAPTEQAAKVWQPIDTWLTQTHPRPMKPDDTGRRLR